MSHKKAYENYFAHHLKRFQALDPRQYVGHYQAMFKNNLPAQLDAPILEIGAGLGKFVFFLKQTGYTHITAVDVSAELSDLANEHCGVQLTIVSDTLEYLHQQKENSFEAVFMLDVIEHLPKDKVIEYLLAVRRVLRPRGRLHVTTENMASPVGGRIQHYLDFTHEYNFSEVSLRQVLEIAGFSQIKFRTLSLRVTGVRSLLLWLAQKVLFGFYRLIYTIERPGLVRPTIFSKDLIVAAEKS